MKTKHKYMHEQSEASDCLILSGLTPLNKGNSRLVFEHPSDPALIVKVLRPDFIKTRYGDNAPWNKRRRRYGFFRSYVREIQEFVAVYASLRHAPSFLQTVYGVIETDLGLGLVSKAVRDRDGSLAPNIATLITNGIFDSTVRSDLETFYHRIQSCDVVISDMNMGNLVYAYSEEQGSHFVLIDGLGNANPFPLKQIFKQVNCRSKRKRFERLCRRIETRLNDAGCSMPPLVNYP